MYRAWEATEAGPSGTAARTVAFYGPPRAGTPHFVKDLEFWKKDDPKAAKVKEDLWKQIEADETSKRITSEKAESSGALIVKNVNLQQKANAFEHETLNYESVVSGDPDAVLRRGKEFRMTITLNRPYNASNDHLGFVFLADSKNPDSNMRVEFDLDGTGKGESYLKNKTWGARLDKDKTKPDLKELSVLVYIPGTAVVAEWEMRIKTTLANVDYVWIYPKPIYVLFNPWSADDLVHFPEDETLLKEYILNEEGNVFVGNQYRVSSFSWFYGQFQKDILQVCFLLLRKAFGFKMTPVMGDPVGVCRALSSIINSNDDNGVLVGNWSGDYSGGVSPTTWSDSVAILNSTTPPSSLSALVNAGYLHNC
ncbi:annulin-like isoform X3 [Pomacea canaliculata]|uniref:annulin-like isoform X3 n=1 Tax=Pomacea canaliculata TaxID=400727 RepID=UPI000D739B28|nr:annulin-like isoform X3 [Pomacea canaliculata]XP_025076047.1 annulin-like isoform X3 [Pomacea canaliculata]XP_025076048.1 annulin-like isoform X3 [Pomacea canaliculata]XP_025076049.1 annulin-like isoform X3 [Pomacea canaliculata]